jgi:hypothetical protein
LSGGFGVFFFFVLDTGRNPKREGDNGSGSARRRNWEFFLYLIRGGR